MFNGICDSGHSPIESYPYLCDVKHLILILTILSLAGCAVQKEARKVTIEDHFITNEFLVQMYDLDQITEVEEEFSKQGLKVVDEVAEWLKMVRIEYDTTSIQPNKMYAKMKLSGYFREIEFNKKLTERSN